VISKLKEILKKIPFAQKGVQEARNFLIFYYWRSKKSSVHLNKNIKITANELDLNGVVKIQESYLEFANYINENYMTSQTPENVVDYSNVPRGYSIAYHLPLNEKKITDFVLDPLIINTLTAYYGTTPYLRNDPLLQHVIPNKETLTSGSCQFHVDRYNQISLMLLLEDVGVQESHMIYLATTQKRKLGFWNLYQKDNEDTRKILIDSNSKNVVHLAGKKGDAFLFNSMGLHRANFILNSKRTILHLNFTNGHNLHKYKNDNNLDHLDNIDNAESILRKDPKVVFVDGSDHQYF